MKLSEKASYLQGLMDGLDIDNTTKEGKVLKQMADIMRELILSMEEIRDEVEEISELCDNLDADLGSLEEDFYECCDDDESDAEGTVLDEVTFDETEENSSELDFDGFKGSESELASAENETEKVASEIIVPEPDNAEYESADEDELYEVICPTCNDTICITESILLDGSMECPNCGEFLEFDLGGDEFLSEDAE